MKNRQGLEPKERLKKGPTSKPKERLREPKERMKRLKERLREPKERLLKMRS